MRSIEKKSIELINSGRASKEELFKLYCEAARKGWDAVIAHCISSGAIDFHPKLRLTLLQDSSKFGHDHVAVVRLLLDSGSDPNSASVMEYCGIASLKLLMEHGGKIDGNLRNSLIVAITERRKDDKALALIELGANVNARDNNKRTPLMFAAAFGRKRVFDALLKAGADTLAVDVNGRSAIRFGMESLCRTMPEFDRNDTFLANDKSGVKSIVKELRDLLPAQPEDTVIVDVVLDDRKRLSDRLKSGLDPNTIFRGAIGSVDFFWDLFVRNTDSDDFDRTFRNGIACVMNNPAEFDNAETLSMRYGESTLLMWAILSESKNCLKLLVQYGADLNFQTANGVSARGLLQKLPFSFELKKIAFGHPEDRV